MDNKYLFGNTPYIYFYGVFVAGGVIHSELVHTGGQWKISRISNDVVWRAGGFRDMAQTR